VGLDKAWLRGLAVALALLLVPLVAWFAIPGRPLPSVGAGSAPTLAPSDLPAEPGQKPESRRRVAGHVVTEEGSAIPGATLTLTRGALSLGQKTSDLSGAFFFSAPDGELAVGASHPGFGAGTTAVAASGDVSDLEITLSKKGSVSGSVVDGEGNAVASAHVACEGDTGQGATSDGEGKFTLPADALGCNATASHPDHGTSSSVTLKAGNRNVITMASPGKIAGTVVDETGSPIALATVAVESFVPLTGDSGLFFKQKKADATGVFELNDLAPGRYVLAASAPGKPPVKTRAIDLASGESSRGLTITLTKGATLSGVVTDRATGDPIAGVSVRLDAATSSGASATGSAVTDAEGRYSLPGVPEAPSSVRFRHTDYTDRIMSIDASSSKTPTQNVDLAKRGTGGDMEMTGIGATLLQGTKFVEIGSVLDDGPAKAAGLLSGDRIERIEGRSAEEFSVSDCVQRLRGPEGTRVTVTLGRGTKTIEVTMTRAKIVR